MEKTNKARLVLAFAGLLAGSAFVQGPNGPLEVKAPPGGAAGVLVTDKFEEHNHDELKGPLWVVPAGSAEIAAVVAGQYDFVATIIQQLHDAIANDGKLSYAEAAPIAANLLSHSKVPSMVEDFISNLVGLHKAQK